MKTSTAVAAAAGAVVIVGLGVMVLGLGLKEEVDFRLTKDSGGVCQPSEPDVISAGWLRKVVWKVTNVDCEPQYVSLRNFKHPLGGGTYDPPEHIVNPDPVEGGPVAIGDPPLKITARVRRFAFGTRFKYEIWLGPTAASVALRRDPDIDIWP